jgi:hypothetical protein
VKPEAREEGDEEEEGIDGVREREFLRRSLKNVAVFG